MRAWLAVVVLLAGCAGSGEKAEEAGAPVEPAASSGAAPSDDQPEVTEAATDAGVEPVPSGEASDAPEVPAAPAAEASAPTAPSWFEAGVQRGEGGVRVSVWAEADSVRGAQRASIDTALKRLASELGRAAPTWEVLRSSVLPAGVGAYRAYVLVSCEEANDG